MAMEPLVILAVSVKASREAAMKTMTLEMDGGFRSVPNASNSEENQIAVAPCSLGRNFMGLGSYLSGYRSPLPFPCCENYLKPQLAFVVGVILTNGASPSFHGSARTQLKARWNCEYASLNPAPRSINFAFPCIRTPRFGPTVSTTSATWVVSLYVSQLLGTVIHRNQERIVFEEVAYGNHVRSSVT